MNFNILKSKPVLSIVTAATISVAAFLGFAGNSGNDLTAGFEGTVLANYRDSVGVETWCVGETQMGRLESGYTKEYCNALFAQRIGGYSARLYSCYTPTMKQFVTPEMHAAFTDLYYNTGTRCSKSIMANLSAGNPVAACDVILRYKYAGGHDCSIPGNRVCSGVWKRRLKMHELCLKGASQL